MKVCTLIYGKQDTPLFHTRILGLLYRDPPDQKKFEVMVDNKARKKAAEENKEDWSGIPDNLKNAKIQASSTA